MTTERREPDEYDRSVQEPPLKMLAAGFIPLVVIALTVLLLL